METIYWLILALLCLFIFGVILFFISRILTKAHVTRGQIILFLMLISIITNFFGLTWQNERSFTDFLSQLSYYLIELIKAISYSWSLFTFKDNFNSLGPIKTNTAFQVIYYLIFILTVTIYATTLLKLLSYRIYSRLSLLLTLKRDVFLFSCINQKTLTLSFDIKKKYSSLKRKALIIFLSDSLGKNDMDKGSIKKVIDEGFLLLETSKGFPRLPKRFCSGIKVFAFNDMDSNNLSFINLVDKKMANSELYCLYNSRTNVIYSDKRNKSNNVYYLNESDIKAQLLSSTNPTYQMLDESKLKDGRYHGDFTYLQIGFRDNNYAYLHQVFQQTQIESCTFKAIVADNDISQFMPYYYFDYPLMKDYIETINAKITDDSFLEFINERIKDFDYVVISLSDDNQNSRLANIISEISFRNQKKLNIAVELKNQDSTIQSYEGVKVYTFGRESDLYTYDIIVKEELDMMAKVLNAVYNLAMKSPNLTNFSNNDLYCKDTNEILADVINSISTISEDITEAEWAKINDFSRMSNRSSIQHLLLKLYISGLKPDKDGTINFYDTLTSNPQLRYSLAKAEHSRWNAFHIANGWRSREIDQANSRKDPILKEHMCLTSWENMLKVNELFNTNYHLFDYLFVDLIDIFLKKINYRISKREN